MHTALASNCPQDDNSTYPLVAFRLGSFTFSGIRIGFTDSHGNAKTNCKIRCCDKCLHVKVEVQNRLYDGSLDILNGEFYEKIYDINR